MVQKTGSTSNIDEPPTLHRYLYANDRPTYLVDPTGHMSRRLEEHYARIEARMRTAPTDEARRKIWAEGMGATFAPTNRLANEIAEPITRRIEGPANLVLPVSYLRDRTGQGASTTRRVQYGLLDSATDSTNSTGTRIASAAGAALLQPGAALHDVAHGLMGVPGKLVSAGQHIKGAFDAENWQGSASEATQAVASTMEAGETIIGAFLLIRGARAANESARADLGASDQAMIDALVRERSCRLQQGTHDRNATFAQGRDVDGRTTPVTESTPSPDGNPAGAVHAEPQVMPSATVAVDQIPCPVCLDGLSSAGTRVIVPQNPYRPSYQYFPMSPKSAAIAAAKGRSPATPMTVLEGRKDPLLLPTLPLPETRTNQSQTASQ